ncbi:hypothetical protein HMPREF9176_1574 [Streptococcus downei F0415]|nr:hypothetical protein HMPREF9176_1574 [Streptococcus downei F0415]
MGCLSRHLKIKRGEVTKVLTSVKALLSYSQTAIFMAIA